MSSPFPVDRMRDAAALAAERTSLRTVAERIGITHRSLSKFLEGANPRAATVRKLTSWYSGEVLAPRIRTSERGKAALTGDEAYMLLRSLVREFPPGNRAAVIRKLVDVLTETYPEGSLDSDWMRDLRRHLGPEPRAGNRAE